MTDTPTELLADHRPYKEHILAEIRAVARTYLWLNALTHAATKDTLRRLAVAIGGEPSPMSNATAWRLTIELVMKHVDRDLGVPGASKAAFARIGAGMRWSDISEGIHRPLSRTKDIVDQAAARLYAEFVVRGISEDYRGEVAA